MFGDAYASSPPFDKVKYGALNVTADMEGVRCAHLYGDSYLRLTTAVRVRATFASADSSTPGVRAVLAACEHCAHVLNAYPDADLAASIDVGCGRRATGRSSRLITMNKEMQIHGPVELSRHVEALFGAPCVCSAARARVAEAAFSCCDAYARTCVHACSQRAARGRRRRDEACAAVRRKVRMQRHPSVSCSSAVAAV